MRIRTFHFDVVLRIRLSTMMRTRIWIFTLMWNRLLTVVPSSSCDKNLKTLAYRPFTTPLWASKAPGWASPWLLRESPQFPCFKFDADPASQPYADPVRSGVTQILETAKNYCLVPVPKRLCSLYKTENCFDCRPPDSLGINLYAPCRLLIWTHRGRTATGVWRQGGLWILKLFV